MGRPLMLKQAGVGKDVPERGWVRGSGGIRAMLGVGAVVILWPEAMQNEAEADGALRFARVCGAELRRPGEIEQIEVEGTGFVCRVRSLTILAPLSATIASLSAGRIVMTRLVGVAGGLGSCGDGGAFVWADGRSLVACIPGNEKHGNEDQKCKQAFVHDAFTIPCSVRSLVRVPLLPVG